MYFVWVFTCFIVFSYTNLSCFIQICFIHFQTFTCCTILKMQSWPSVEHLGILVINPWLTGEGLLLRIEKLDTFQSYLNCRDYHVVTGVRRCDDHPSRSWLSGLVMVDASVKNKEILYFINKNRKKNRYLVS